MTKKIYDLKPLESIGAKELGGAGFSVLRVPGGWLFMFNAGISFVPFHNEFQPKGPKSTPARKKAASGSASKKK
jgi:hypothetical protein